MPRSVPPGVRNLAQSLPVVRGFFRPHDQSGNGPSIVTGAATLTGLGTLVATAMLVIPANATAAGTGTLTSAAIAQQAGAATLSGSSSLASVGLVQVLSGATTSGTSTLSGSSRLIIPAGASLAGSSLTGVDGGAEEAPPDGSVGGGSPFALIHNPGRRLLTDEASLEGRSALRAEGEVLRVARAAPKRKAPAVSRARAKVVARLAAAELHGAGSLAAAGHVITPASEALLAGQGTLSVAGETIRSTTVDHDEDEELLLLLGVL